jgi:hypothetical protein
MAQDEPFKGGSGDGFSIDTFNQLFLDFTVGAIGDGFTSFSLINDFSNYSKGGIGDGFSSTSLLDDFADYCYGGIGDGFSASELNIEFLDFTSGGNSDGFSYAFAQDDYNHMFSGGSADGFAYDKYGHIIHWTGTIGTGWNVAGNWENEIIPTFCNPVVIPAGVPNFPAVNSGILRIGYYKDEGDYRCQRIKINTNAEMTTRVNCFVENYDLMFIRGTLFVKNPASNAFTNSGEGLVLLKPNASVIFKE